MSLKFLVAPEDWSRPIRSLAPRSLASGCRDMKISRFRIRLTGSSPPGLDLGQDPHDRGGNGAREIATVGRAEATGTPRSLPQRSEGRGSGDRASEAS